MAIPLPTPVVPSFSLSCTASKYDFLSEILPDASIKSTNLTKHASLSLTSAFSKTLSFDNKSVIFIIIPLFYKLRYKFSTSSLVARNSLKALAEPVETPYLNASL